MLTMMNNVIYCCGCFIFIYFITTHPGCCSEEREGGSKENIEKRKEEITNSHEGIEIFLVKFMSAICSFKSSPAAGEIPRQETTKKKLTDFQIFIFFSIHA